MLLVYEQKLVVKVELEVLLLTVCKSKLTTKNLKSLLQQKLKHSEKLYHHLVKGLYS